MDDDFDDDIFLTGANDNAQDNMILPFQLEETPIRGRLVRLGQVLDQIITPHAYPPPVAQLVGEAVGLTLLLGGMLKFEGTFTLQAQGDGPVRMVVADLTTDGTVRGMASFDPVRLNEVMTGCGVVALRPGDPVANLATLMGQGHLAFTVDQGAHTDRYQGIVALDSVDLATSVAHYFQQSEQIDTALKMAAGPVGGRMRMGGVMVQRLPVTDGDDAPARDQADDEWDHARALVQTCTNDELLSDDLYATDLLFRLFHEKGVRVFNPQTITKGCRCNAEKLAGILRTMSPDDLAHMTENGKITMTCEFCNKDFGFDPGAIQPIDPSP